MNEGRRDVAPTERKNRSVPGVGTLRFFPRPCSSVCLSDKQIPNVKSRRLATPASLRYKTRDQGATESAPAEVPSERLTPLALDKTGIIGHHEVVGLAEALTTCRVRYARKPSFVFVCSSCLWFLPPIAVEESKSRGVGYTEPTATVARCRMPEAGGWLPNVSAPRLLKCKSGGTKRECL